MNSGEGGLLTTSESEVMARAVMHSGSYMLYARNDTALKEEVFDDIKLDTPNYSGRMDNLRATILRAQFPLLDENCKRWNERYDALTQRLKQNSDICLPERPQHERYVASSLQFRIRNITVEQVITFIDYCDHHGVEIKWLGSGKPQGFTSRYDSWRYIETKQHLPKTLFILATTFDLRIPLTFTIGDMQDIGEIIDNAAQHLHS